ncbi:hypothetical protein [Longispora albida]|uniref:hypothetical protein n=1 Tax=Longispora albida TaxID=203523 RepID=UPI000379BBC5|nr:hypothetical protein [Longispora albida]
MTASFAADLRTELDRVYQAFRAGTRTQGRAVLARYGGIRPGLLIDVYHVFLAGPVTLPALEALTRYWEPEAREQALADHVHMGVFTVDGNAIHLTDLGRDFALGFQAALGTGAAELWAASAALLPALNDTLATLLTVPGGPAFEAARRPYLPPDATLATQVTTRMGAFRYRRADLHAQAWAAAGHTAQSIRALEPGPERESVEAETNRLDAPSYSVLPEESRRALFATLTALPG